MKSRYDTAEAKRYVNRYAARWGEPLALRVYTSHLLGNEPGLVLHGGGNTSIKTEARELTGETVRVLCVKGSGHDLGRIEPEGFPACRLEPLRRMAEVAELGDEQIVRGLRSQMLDPSGPTPSVEALLHALIEAPVVDHTHADAALAIIDQPDSEARAREVWGDDVVFVPYVKPGFSLAKRVAELGDALSRTSLMVLDKHGLFTWGKSPEESYERMIDAVSRAERYLAERAATATVSVPADDTAERRRRQRALSPLVRGALGRAPQGSHFVLVWRDESEIRSLLARPDAKELAAAGNATPDYVIRTKAKPAWLGALQSELPVDEAVRAVEGALADYARDYEAYFERHAAGRELGRIDPLPRVLLVPGLGALCAGDTLDAARIAGDVTLHTAKVMQNAQSIGSYRPVGEAELFEVETWSLEQNKLQQPAGLPLERRLALVTGAAAGIGAATAERLLELGAHVALSDRDAERLEATAARLAERFGSRVTSAVCDVTRDDEVVGLVAATIDAFGGLDLVVSNAGTAPSGLLHEAEGADALVRSLEINLISHQRVARAASAVLLTQGLGGCLLFNASKSAFNQGPRFGPYAIPKAGVVALMKQYAVDLGSEGIRTGAVNADRIRTDLFGGGVLEARAKARGVSPDEYFRQNLLGRETTGRDVADAFAYLATAGATTGCVLTVDGGNPAAFPR